MSHYGYEIVQTLIVDIEPDERVKKAMNEINAGKFFFFFFLSVSSVLTQILTLFTGTPSFKAPGSCNRQGRSRENLADKAGRRRS